MSILVVDDEPRLRGAIARSLAAHGYRVDEANDGASAIEAARHGHFDLMVLDINLPDITGWDVLRAMASWDRAPSTVMISAVPPSTLRVREFKPYGVLHKPFPIDALLRLVRDLESGMGFVEESGG